jgi:hypothetical protein
MRRGLFLLITMCGCTGEIMAGGDDDDGAAPSLSFVSPADGDTFVRDDLSPGGFLAADVPVAVVYEGAQQVELSLGDTVLGLTDPSGRYDAFVASAGPATITARALLNGEVVAEASVEVTITEASATGCREQLDLYGVTYDEAGAQPGVDDALQLHVPVNGMSWRYSGNAAPRTSFAVVDCSLALSLAQAAPLLRARGVVEVTDIGVYNYRCIGGVGTPPDCPNGISQHAYAKAIDIAGLTDEAGTFYSVNDDWVIDPDAEETCDAPTEAGADDFLHRAICELKAAGVWNIVLTPNYNADHRNHFHVDLTPDADFIEKSSAPFSE